MLSSELYMICFLCVSAVQMSDRSVEEAIRTELAGDSEDAYLALGMTPAHLPALLHYSQSQLY